MGNHFENKNENKTTPSLCGTENYTTNNDTTNDVNNTENNTKNKPNKIFTKKRYVWIDPLIDNEENTFYYNQIFVEKKLNCKKYNNIDEAYEYLIQKPNEFREIVIIISGKLFIRRCEFSRNFIF